MTRTYWVGAGCDVPSSRPHITPQPLQREGQQPAVEFPLHVSGRYLMGPFSKPHHGPGVRVREGALLKGTDAGHKAGQAHNAES